MGEVLKSLLQELKDSNEKIVDNLSLDTKNFENVTKTDVETLGEIVTELLQKYSTVKKLNTEYSQWLFGKYEEGKSCLKALLERKDLKVQKIAAFKVLINMLPLEKECVMEKPYFPDDKYAEIMKVVIHSDGDLSVFIGILGDYMIYEDMNLNIWKALDIASSQHPLAPNQVRNILTTIGLFSPISKNQEKPQNYFCRTKLGVLNAKKMNECARRIWERLMVVDIPLRTRQLLLITLLEKIMPVMVKPVFLTDYFMSSLEYGGAITLLSLQGIFELIQKHNINYPNIYGKLYSMFRPEIFETSYKARFYYLADLFLSSLHLPEALVAGFVKRLARLALVAPPPDIIILMAFITNLIIRHSGLNVLITNMKTMRVDSDPYLENEKDPSESRALDSSLWEILLLQNHIFPSVSHSAMFVNNPLPTVEVDLSSLLEVTMDEMFEKEVKKKIKDAPLNFEKPTPTFLSLENNQQGFTNWNFAN